MLIHTAEPPRVLRAARLQQRALARARAVSRTPQLRRADQVTFDQLMRERDRMFAKHPKTQLHRRALRLARQRPRRAAALLDKLPNVYLEVARSSTSSAASRAPRASSSPSTRTACCSARTPTQPTEYPVLLARVRDQRRVLRLLPRLSRVLEAVRHGSARRRAEEAVLQERAEGDAGIAGDRLARPIATGTRNLLSGYVLARSGRESPTMTRMAATAWLAA